MTDILVTPDPVLRARAFLSRFFERVEVTVPAGWDYSSPLLHVRDGGGSGPYDAVLDECLLTVEVTAPRIAEASSIARSAFGVMQAWPGLEKGVYWRSCVGRPVFESDTDNGIPMYVFTVEMAFRMEAATIDDLSARSVTDIKP